MEEPRPAAELKVFRDPLQMLKWSTAKPRRLRALLFSLRPPPLFDCVSSHRQPHVSEQRVVGRSTDAGAVEPFVPGVLQPDARIEPRPTRRETGDKWDIGDLGDPAVGIRAEIWGAGVEDRIRAAPGSKILSGQNHPVVVAIGQGRVSSRFVEFIFRIGSKKIIK